MEKKEGKMEGKEERLHVHYKRKRPISMEELEKQFNQAIEENHRLKNIIWKQICQKIQSYNLKNEEETENEKGKENKEDKENMKKIARKSNQNEENYKSMNQPSNKEKHNQMKKNKHGNTRKQSVKM